MDYEAYTAGGSPLYQTVKIALHGCRIILVCELGQAAEAAQATRLREALDYIVVDSVFDPNRISLLIERFCIDRLWEQPDKGHSKEQRRQIMETLKELRGILKNRGENPVAILVNTFKANSLASSPTCGLFESRLAETYHCSQVDLICGCLKRLENAVRLSEDKSIDYSANPTGACILVVEDDAVCGEMAKYILERHGFDVILAATAGDAKAALTRHNPAVVLMDIHLGETNGLWLIKAMRAGQTCPDVPVVVVSSDRMQGTVRDAARWNVQGYLLKPYQPSLMVRTVKSALANSKQG